IMPQNIGDNRIVENGIARITPTNAKRLSRYLVREGDIIYSRRGDVERRALVRKPEDGWLCGTGCLRIRFGGKSVDPKYASFYLGHPSVREWMVRHAHGATMPNLNTSILAACPFVVPPLLEQRAIAQILGVLDDKIELNRRMNETLEAMARALFKSWFVDFDPVRAKAEGRDPGLPKPLADAFPDSFEDSEMGEIPNGWEVGPLADVATLNPESWSKDTRPATINYVDLSNTKWGRIESVTTHTRQDAPSRAQRVLRSGDTIIGTVRPGNGSYAFVTEERLTGSTGFAALRPQRQEYREYVYLAATTAENIEELAHLADGAAYPAVRPEVVAATVSVRPPDFVLKNFAKAAAPPLLKIAASERESRTLAHLRDTLLPKLISGELRMKHAERFLEAQL
ncbi:MAG TPA: restriction endonuclease subunit S, partial [Blastocatellia bacterium]|nr:restriction endonuclease subunit S [Blastocatellia bacterium]